MLCTSKVRICNRTLRDYAHVKPTYSIAFATPHALKWHGSNCHKVTRMNICTFHLHFSQIAFRNRRVSSFLNICTAKQWGYKNRRVGRWRHTSATSKEIPASRLKYASAALAFTLKILYFLSLSLSCIGPFILRPRFWKGVEKWF